MRWRTTTPSGSRARASRTCRSTAARAVRRSPDGPPEPPRRGACVRPARAATLEAVAESSAAEVWCLGDLVGYGAEPDACVALAREHAAVCLAGNHDLAVTGDIPLDEFSRGARLPARWTQEVSSPESLAFLKSLSPQAEEGTIGLYHASPRDPVWEYVVSALLAELCLDVQRRRVCLVGHSHVALSFVRREAQLTTGEP